MTSDPFEVLGLARSATVAEIRAARRRLALELHPDRGGDAARMQVVNAAFDAAVAHATGRRPLHDPAPPGSPAPSAPSRRPRDRGDAPVSGWHVEHDAPSFTIDALPVEAFEALLVVASWMGEVANDDPPYVLEVHLTEPADCWCRLELVPDAGASTVSLAVATTGAGRRPSVEEVRDAWVANLNALGAPPP